MNRNTRTFLVIGVAVAVAAVASVVLYGAIQQMPVREVEVARMHAVVSARHLPIGTMLTAADLKVVPWPAASPVPQGFGEIEPVVGRGLVGHLSRKLCLRRGSCGVLEAGLEHGIELVEHTLDTAGRRFPSSLVQRGHGEAEFQFQGGFGVEIATAVAPQAFELPTDGLDDIRGGERHPHGVWVLEEREIVDALFSEFCDPGGVGVGKAGAEFLKLLVADVDVPGGLDGAPALVELGGVGFGQMTFRVPLHVDRTELDLRLREQTVRNLEEPGEIVLHEDHHAAETALDETAEDGLPVFDVFPAEFGDATQDPLFPVAPEPNGEVDTGGAESIPVAEFDILAINKEGEQVGAQGPTVAQVQFVDDAGGHPLEILLGPRQPHLLQRPARGIDRAA